MSGTYSGNGDFDKHRIAILERLDDLKISYKELVGEVTQIRVEIATLKTRMQMQAAVVAAIVSPIMSFIVARMSL